MKLAPRIIHKKSRFCTSPRHTYRCERCGLLTSGREDADGRVYAYDRAANCEKHPQPRPSLCPSEAPCILPEATP